MEVYLDLVVLLNFLVDFLLLMGTNRLAGFPPGTLRCAGAATIGAVYGGACLLPGFRFLGNLLWRSVSLVLMAAMAFGCDKSAVKRGGLFVLLSMALGGIALNAGKQDFLALLAAAGVCWLLCQISFSGGAGNQEYIPITLSYGERTVNLIALRDTGNTLRDPVTGEQVLVISGDAAGRLTGLTREQLAAPLETLTKRPVPGLRLIPYRAVGQSGGMLLAMRFENIQVGGQKRSAIVAFAAEGLGQGSIYQALTGGAI